MSDRLKGVRVRIIPMGCRTNISESEALCSSFAAAGAVLAPEGPLDVAVLVSCSVTAEADRKSRQAIRRLRRENTRAVILATGCWAQGTEPGDARSLGIDCIVGNGLKHRIPEIVREMLSGGRTSGSLRIERTDVQDDHGWDPLFITTPQNRTRAFIKIQDGCSHRCSYCIIPDLRGRSVERPPEDVLREVKRVALSGCSEVVFTGINLGMFGKTSGMLLGELVRRAGDISGIERIRFGSLEPFAINEVLLRDISQTRQFCPHLHLPLQSGDNGILGLMRRGYSSEDFARCVDLARDFFGEDLHISTDIIAGFPGESDEAFDATLSLLKAVKTGRLHVFPFSPRHGTPAERLAGRIPHGVIRSRVSQALALGRDLLDACCRRWIGSNIDVLVEKCGEGHFEGLSPHYLRVEVLGLSSPGRSTTVTVTDAVDGILKGFV